LEARQSMLNSQTQPVLLPVARLMDGYLTTQLLWVAARLKIADSLAEGPQTPEALAQGAGANPEILRRVLRGLAAEGVFDELSDGRFGLTGSGACLRSDAPGSLRGAIIARGDLYYRAAAGLFEAVRDAVCPSSAFTGAASRER
jgi:hypothetical protein